MIVTLSDDKVFDHKYGRDEDGNFITFTTTAVVDEIVVVEENPSDGANSLRVLICQKLLISFARLLQRMQ